MFLLGAALLATGQLGAEASRAFLALPYPMHFLRIALVLGFAAGFGFMLIAYLARRFELPRLWPVLVGQTIAATFAILAVPSFDQKTGLVLASAIAIGMLLAIRAALRSGPGALPLAAMLALGLMVCLAQPYSFLDRDLYLWTAGLFVLIFVGEARRVSGAADPADAGVQEPLAASGAPTGLFLGTGAERRFVLRRTSCGWRRRTIIARCFWPGADRSFTRSR